MTTVTVIPHFTGGAMFELDGEPIAIRGAVEDDMRFIMQTWVRSYKPIVKLNEHVYDREQPELIKRILARPTTNVAVACSPDMQSTIHGWACGDSSGLHYAYIPIVFRKRGLARELIKAAIGAYPQKIEVTHRFHNPVADHTRFVFNPYRLGVVL